MDATVIRPWLVCFLVAPLLVAARSDGQPQPLSSPAAFEALASATPTVGALPDGRQLQVGLDGIRVIGKRGENPTLVLGLGRRDASVTVTPTGQVLIWGGLNAAGTVVSEGLWFDPATTTLKPANDVQLIPRVGHRINVLTDGRIVVSGGWSSAFGMMPEIEVWNPRTQLVSLGAGEIRPARLDAVSTLQADGSVAITGGVDAKNREVTGSVVFDPETTRVNTIAVETHESVTAIPTVVASIPAPDATNVDPATWIAVRFSPPLDSTTLDERTVTLIGPAGAIAGNITPVENGRLFFFVPRDELYPGVHYTLFVDGARTRAGKSLPFTAIGYSTALRSLASGDADANSPRPMLTDWASESSPTVARAPLSRVQYLRTSATAREVRPGCAATMSVIELCRDQAVVKDGFWFPGKNNLGGRWRINGKYPLVPGEWLLVNRAIPSKISGVYGQILRIDDTPVANVSVSIGSQTTLTDANGAFVLSDIPTGHEVLAIDGSSANSPGVEYGSILAGVDIKAHTMTPMRQVLYLPRIHAQDKVKIPSPTTMETVITHPEIPGLEIRIPANTVIRDRHGHVLTELAIVPTPSDRSPVPLPANFPVYFSLQPSGAIAQTLTSDGASGVRIVYPHDPAAGANRVNYDFWLYDPDQQGWKVYSRGHLSADQTQLLADSGLGPLNFMPSGYSVGGPTPPSSSPPPGSCEDQCDIDAPPDDNQGSGGGGCASDCSGGSDSSGDPVDSASGLFLFHRTDLAVNDIIPIRIARTYRSANSTPFALGPGTSFNYGMYLFNPSGSTYPPELDLVLADGSIIPFDLISGNLGAFGPGLWVSTSVPGRFDGAQLTNTEFSSPCGICIKLKDGTTYTFPAQGDLNRPSWLQSVIDRNGNTLALSYSGNLLTQVTSPSGRHVTFSYNTANVVSQISDNSGRTISYTYNPAGLLSTVAYPDNTTERYTYDGNGNMLTAIDRRGKTIFTNQYDGNQRIIRQTLADNAVYTWDYTLSSSGTVQETNITDPNSIVRHVTFDAVGYPLTVTRASGTPLAQTTTFVRGPDERVISATDPLGRVTASAYDAFGNLTTRTYLFGTTHAATFSYTYTSAFHQVATETDPLGNTTTRGYDNNGCLNSVADPLGHSVSFTCNSAGQFTSMTDALGHTSTLSYSGYDLHTITDPHRRAVTLTTDILGRITAVTDPLGHQRQNQYDTNNRIVRAIDALNQATNLIYDEDGHPTLLTDPNNRTTQWGYDSRNRVILRTDALNQMESWTYDGLGQVLTYTDRKNQLVQFHYDALDRTSSITYADGAIVTPIFDAGNRLTQLQDSVAGTITRTFDEFNRVIQEQTQQGTISYIYDVAGRRTQMTAASQSPVNYGYDNANRLTQISQGSETVQFAYDSANRRTTLTLPNGITMAYSYDNASQLVGITYLTGSGVQLAALGYSYDSDGKIASKAGGFQADSLPTPTTATGVFDSNNRQTSFDGTSVSYDDNGNLTNDGVNTYVWNARNQLVQVNQGANTVGSFAYDTIGRRTSKTVNGITTNFLYDGWNTVQETQGSAVVTLLAGMGIDERFARDETAGRRYFLADALGSTIALTDINAAVLQTYGYEPYGEVNAIGSSTNPYQYTGRENDGTGLYYYRARYYSPAMKRFISSDPLGLRAGLNSYAYVKNNPLSFIDPFGLKADLILAFPGTAIYNDAMLYTTPDGAFSVVAHARPDGMRDDTLVPYGPLLHADELAERIRHGGWTPGQPIILLGCHTGTSGPDVALAQDVADILGTDVQGVDKYLFFDDGNPTSNGATEDPNSPTGYTWTPNDPGTFPWFTPISKW